MKVGNGNQIEVWWQYVRMFSRAYDCGLQFGTEIVAHHHDGCAVAGQGNAEAEDQAVSIGKKVVLCSPHPDDECLTGALPLRMLREGGYSVVNLAVTLGSDINRRAARLKELIAACKLVGFDHALVVSPHSLTKVNSVVASADYVSWKGKVRNMVDVFQQQRPDVVFLPHADDVHPTHEGVHLLTLEALKLYTKEDKCRVVVVENEFWRPMKEPCLLVGIDDQTLAILIAGLVLHVGEVGRNPYHLRMPARMMDNVRRGWELLRGHQQRAPDFYFGELYGLSVFEQGMKVDRPQSKMVIPPGPEGVELLTCFCRQE